MVSAELMDDLLDQIRAHEIEVAKLASDDPHRPALDAVIALEKLIMQMLIDGELDPAEARAAVGAALK